MPDEIPDHIYNDPIMQRCRRVRESLLILRYGGLRIAALNGVFDGPNKSRRASETAASMKSSLRNSEEN